MKTGAASQKNETENNPAGEFHATETFLLFSSELETSTVCTDTKVGHKKCKMGTIFSIKHFSLKTSRLVLKSTIKCPLKNLSSIFFAPLKVVDPRKLYLRQK